MGYLEGIKVVALMLASAAVVGILSESGILLKLFASKKISDEVVVLKKSA